MSLNLAELEAAWESVTRSSGKQKTIWLTPDGIWYVDEEKKEADFTPWEKERSEGGGNEE